MRNPTPPCSSRGRSLPWARPVTLLALVLLSLRVYAAPAEVVGAVQMISTTPLSQVQYAPASKAWTDIESTPYKLYGDDRVRTLTNSSAALTLTNRGLVQLGELTTVQVFEVFTNGQRGLSVLQGVAFLLLRDKPDRITVRTPFATAAARGTEFLVEVEANGATRITVFDGTVATSNELGSVLATNTEQVLVEPGAAPAKTSVLTARRVVQWWLYYPAVLNPDDLDFTAAEQVDLAASLEHYRAGDLLKAFGALPTTPSASAAGKTYEAALLLAVNQPAPATNRLAGIDSVIANALREMVFTVTRGSGATNIPGTSATALLARSYALQAGFHLVAARDAAEQAARAAANFGFAWARLAELEFSLGHTREAEAALKHALRLSPGHARARVVLGFILSSRNELRAAMDEFDKAIQTDGHLGEAWLGRGLCRIRRGDLNGGRSDLLMAAGLEPQRSVFRSYLGKAYGDAGNVRHAAEELARARHLDTNDPTPLLYSALEMNRQNRINEAIGELERSLALNDNRRVYRSRLLLDEDRAVRGASLAAIYRRAGLDEVAVREAARVVSYDYANYSAHQFLAESFDALRDPARVNLRYETPWSVEYLLATLLAPVGAGPLSQQITAQEYSRLFTRDRVGLTTDTEVRSDGRVRELSSQFGTMRGTDWALDLDYQHDDGTRCNQDLSRLEWYTRAKQQITPQDTLLLLTKYYGYEAGDVRQVDPRAAHPALRVDESQTPLALAGWHHEWSPGIHTLFLGGRLEDELRVKDTNVNRLLVYQNVVAIEPLPFSLQYRSEFETYTAELNQILQSERTLTILGARFQIGEFTTRNSMAFSNSDFGNISARARHTEDFERISAYSYETFELVRDLRLTAGVSYDRVTSPRNFRDAPIWPGEIVRDRVNPKLALVWTPWAPVTLRSAYARSLGGVSFDESFRLEPGQLAGFSQSHRTIISESVAGSVSTPLHETAGAAVDLKFASRAYVGISGQWLNSEVRRDVGVFRVDSGNPPPFTGVTRQELDYEEQSFALTVNQLVGDFWSLGARWRVTRGELEMRYTEPRVNAPASAQRIESVLHAPGVWVAFNEPHGFFARVEGNWLIQQNEPVNIAPGALPLGDESYPELSFAIGWRFPKQRGEISAGALNALDHDHSLNPLTVLAELPRERVWFTRLKVSF